MTTAEQLAQTATKINEAILKAEPSTLKALDYLITPFLQLGMRYKAKKVLYYGAIQGVNVHLHLDGRQKKVNPRNIRYGIFS